MDLRKTERKARRLFRDLKKFRGAFIEGDINSFGEYYSLYVDKDFYAVHIAHNSNIVISINETEMNIRVEKGFVKGFDADEFLDGFRFAFKRQKEDLTKIKKIYDEALAKDLKDRLNELGQ